MKSQFSTKRATMTAGILATVMTFSVPGYAHAQEKAPPTPQQGPAESMGSMQQQMMHGMMHQMETCMERMGKMDESARMDDSTRKQMQSQMMARMQSCMSQMQSGEAEHDSGAKHGSQD